MLEGIILAIVLGFGFNQIVATDTCEISRDAIEEGKVVTVTDTYKQEYCDTLQVVSQRETKEQQWEE